MAKEFTGTLKLRTPIMINGALCSEIPYNFEALTVTDMLDVDRARSAEGRAQPVLPKFEGYTQFMLFCAAVAKRNAHIAPEDLRRLSARDGMAAQELGAGFFCSTARRMASRRLPTRNSRHRDKLAHSGAVARQDAGYGLYRLLFRPVRRGKAPGGRHARGAG